MPPPGFICVGVATTVTVQHSPTVQRPNVRHALLSLVDDIKNILPFQTTYTGNQSVQADMVVNLQGVPPRDMNKEETDLFERVMLNFVSEKLRDDYDISGAEVISQSSGGTGSGRRSLMPDSAEIRHSNRGRSLQSSSAESLAVTVRVTGESRNPRKRQLEDKIEDTIDNNSVAFTEELTSAAKQDPVVSAYFERVEEVSARPVDGEDSPPGPSPGVLNSSSGETGPNIGLIVGCVIGGIVAIAAAVLLYVKGAVGGSKKKKNQQSFERELSSFGSSQRFDGYESKPPPYSGNGGASIKPAMYGNGIFEQRGYENTKLPMPMQTKKQIYGAPGTAAMQSKKAFANHGDASRSRSQRVHGNDSTLDAKLAYNGAPTNMPGRARQTQSGPSRKFDTKLAYNGAPVPQSSRQMPANGRSNSRDNLERKIATNGGPIAGSVRVGNGQRSNSRPMRTAGDSVSSASGGNRIRRQGYHSSQGMRPSSGRGSRQSTHSLDSVPPRGGRTSRTSPGGQSPRINESGLSSNSGGFRGEEDLHFR